MASLNRVSLIGNLGADPEIRRLNSGDMVVNLRIACTDTWRDKQSGERKERTEWVSAVLCNEGLCKVAEQYLKKGSRIFLEGSLQTRSWEDQSGQKRYSTEVVLQKFRGELIMLDGPSGDKQAGGHRQERTSYDDRDTRGGDALDEDAIPFAAEWR